MDWRMPREASVETYSADERMPPWSESESDSDSISKWFDLFADATYADACLARLTDCRNGYRLEMNGKSMRDLG